MALIDEIKGVIYSPTEEEIEYSREINHKDSYLAAFYPERWNEEHIVEKRLGLKRGPFKNEKGEYRFGLLYTWAQDDGGIKYDYELYDEHPFGNILQPVWECTTYARIGGVDVISSVEEV